MRCEKICYYEAHVPSMLVRFGMGLILQCGSRDNTTLLPEPLALNEAVYMIVVVRPGP